MRDAPLTAILQPKGLLHRFIRSKDTSSIVERPERLRAVAVGIAAAAARLEEHQRHTSGVDVKDEADALRATDSLTDALRRLAISPSLSDIDRLANARTTSFNIVTASSTKLDILNHEAVRFIHGEAHEYLAKLDAWASSSEEKIRAGESEIPAGYSQGDLYCTCSSDNSSMGLSAYYDAVCPQSIEAIAGSIAAVCEAVDISFGGSRIVSETATNSTSSGAFARSSSASEPEPVDFSASPFIEQEGVDATQVSHCMEPLPNNPRRVFTAIRPPGHHCSDEMPSGFCFVNNVLIGAAHGELTCLQL
jgi:histone deacetylase HOS3